MLLDEARLGYPEHLWLAVGHMAEAESEALEMSQELAEEIRNHRTLLIEDHEYEVPVLELIRKTTALEKGERRWQGTSRQSRTSKRKRTKS